jgi:hypothetical protein
MMIMNFLLSLILGVLTISGTEIFLQLLVRKLIYGIRTGIIFNGLLLAVLAFFLCVTSSSAHFICTGRSQ